MVGSDPYEEDTWKRIRIGNVEFHAAQACSRCVMTTVDPHTGKFSERGEPLRTLRTYRTKSLYGKSGESFTCWFIVHQHWTWQCSVHFISINQSINQFNQIINQSIQSINSINQSINQSINRSIAHSSCPFCKAKAYFGVRCTHLKKEGLIRVGDRLEVLERLWRTPEPNPTPNIHAIAVPLCLPITTVAICVFCVHALLQINHHLLMFSDHLTSTSYPAVYPWNTTHFQ